VANLDGAAFFYYIATGVTPAMAEKMVGKGSQYPWCAQERTASCAGRRTFRSKTSGQSRFTSRNGKNRTLRHWNGSERSKLAAFHAPILAPDVITREIDVFPAEG
jgi:hypothetical protein